MATDAAGNPVAGGAPDLLSTLAALIRTPVTAPTDASEPMATAAAAGETPAPTVPAVQSEEADTATATTAIVTEPVPTVLRTGTTPTPAPATETAAPAADAPATAQATATPAVTPATATITATEAVSATGILAAPPSVQPSAPVATQMASPTATANRAPKAETPQTANEGLPDDSVGAATTPPAVAAGAEATHGTAAQQSAQVTGLPPTGGSLAGEGRPLLVALGVVAFLALAALLGQRQRGPAGERMG